MNPAPLDKLGDIGKMIIIYKLNNKKCVCILTKGAG